jgi:hypothetical protein
MCAMTRPRDSAPAAIAPAPVVPQQLQVALLWAGALLCGMGMATTGLWQHWHGGRFAELLVLSLVSLALAWPLQRLARMPLHTALACVWIAALIVFADPLPVLAVLVVAAAATVVGGWIAGAAAPAALACACGLALIAGVLGWLLPLPVHNRWTYLALCAVLIGIGHRDLRVRLRALRSEWSAATEGHPHAAALAVLALGLASTGCWLPTMQFDDLAYHVGLPWQLTTIGRYALDPTHQVWALAPWAADVQHALPQVIAGAEARGPLNALWIAVTAAGLWNLSRALGADARVGWAAIALYASLPLTAGLAAGMQTETAAAALTVWLAWLVVRSTEAPVRAVWAGAVLFGGLVGLKLMGIAYAAVLLACAVVLMRSRPGALPLLVACVVVFAVGASSYMYATVIAGNPVLPLFNAAFQSPYFAASDFQDVRWQAGLPAMLPWSLTFATGNYSETLPGSAGFALVALAGAWIVSLQARPARVVTLAASTMLVLVFVPVQYLRYAFPALVLLMPLLAMGASIADARRWTLLVAAVCVLGFAFQANGNWMQRNGALKETVLAAGRDAPLLLRYAPERLLATQLRGADAGSVLYLDDRAPAHAELGSAGRTTAWYAPGMQAAAARADADASGARWSELLRQAGIGEVIARAGSISPAQAAGLRRAGATLQATAGDAQWWRLPREPAP